MKILYLYQYFSTPKASGGTRSYDLAKKFIENGHEVEFITTSTGFTEEFDKKWNYMEIENIKFHILNTEKSTNSTSYLKRIFIFMQFTWFASLKILKLECDIVLASSTPLTIGIPALIKKWFHKKPFIFEARDVWPEAVIAIGAIKNKIAQKLLYGLEAMIYRNAIAVVPLSVDMKSSITGRFPNLNCPVETIENISELNRFKNGYDPNISVIREHIGIKPRFAILYAGTFGKVNGLGYLVDLAAKLLPIDPSIVFILVGSGAEKEELIQAAEQKKVLDKNVFFLDSVPKDRLPQFYFEVQMGSSFVIALKELWANSANKFFDTLAAGRPVLINHEGWQKDTLIKNDAGFILPYSKDSIDPNFLNSFVAYTKNKQKQKQQRQNALRLAESYSLESAVQKYLALIEVALNKEP